MQSALPDGYASVQTRSLVPQALESVSSGAEFVDRLPEFDAEFEKLREEARAEGSVLRFVGVVDVENGIVKADLEKYAFAMYSKPGVKLICRAGTPRPTHSRHPLVARTTLLCSTPSDTARVRSLFRAQALALPSLRWVS